MKTKKSSNHNLYKSEDIYMTVDPGEGKVTIKSDLFEFENNFDKTKRYRIAVRLFKKGMKMSVRFKFRTH